MSVSSTFQQYQTENRDPAGDLDFAITSIVNCDNEYCADLKDMLMDATFSLVQLQHPQLHADLERCAEQGRSDDECIPIFIDSVNRVQPYLHSLIDRKRQATQPDPLQAYDGVKYGSPFWFEGAGDIWRRIAHQSKIATVKDCARVRADSEQCLADPSKPNDYCFRLYGHALVCEPGVNCPYLRFPLMKCLQETHQTDFQRLKNCAESIPNFHPCTRGYVPQERAV